ncbi:hypothetical protein NDU88_006536 [Pleurodeles waltl]|uniref:Uncharacterized protein n=1 Tax=Pleurodeles waltl TaxID=8319 RepID=A0AAV7PIM8_PLEWA|nr:hypothetical protein NDU88_006536 [Pleurodeles waltl]
MCARPEALRVCYTCTKYRYGLPQGHGAEGIKKAWPRAIQEGGNGGTLRNRVLRLSAPEPHVDAVFSKNLQNWRRSEGMKFLELDNRSSPDKKYIIDVSRPFRYVAQEGIFLVEDILSLVFCHV